MFESFLNPGYLAAGAALVSLPIIIHLINRMRFKRVRWAAMEFLLKSQRRNRRRLIIEQLLLLALRCLLVLLAVILVSRYLGFSWAIFEPQNTLHVVVLDDTLSMTDQWKEEGEVKDCFRAGKELITKEIARNALQARTAQRLVLIFLSEPGIIHFDQRLNQQSLVELQNALEDARCTALHVDLVKGVEAAKELIEKVPQDRRILHLISDFRQRDWSEATAGLHGRLDELSRSGVKINLVDTAHPYRSDIQNTPLYHDNLAVVDLRPEIRVAAQNMPVQFSVTVANFGVSERKNLRVTVKVNGSERLEGSVNLTVRPGVPKSETFQIAFDQLGYNEISANLEDEEVGLRGDNTRYAVIQVRKHVPVLIIDGDPINGTKVGGDTFHLQTLLTSAKGYQAVPRGANELEQSNLDQYASIYLLNVRQATEKGLRNLENYIREGGNVAFFLGDRVDPDYYTKKLYAEGKGLFPAPLADRPFPPIADPEMEPDLFDGQLKIFVRDPSQPIFAEVWQPRYRRYFQFLPIRRYYPVPRRNWNRAPGAVEEIVTLPNRRSMNDYAIPAQEILDSIAQLFSDTKGAKYRAGLERHHRAIRDTLVGDKPLYELAKELEALLEDRGEAENPERPNLVEFWNQTENHKLQARIAAFRETVQLGDPLVISKQYGKGRVIAFLTTAGSNWNGWAGGSLASPTYPAVMLELQKYLTRGGDETNQILGNPLSIEVDSNRYDGKMHSYFQPEARDAARASAGNDSETPGASSGLVDLGESVGSPSAGRITFVQEPRKNGPGLYLFDFTRLREEGNPSSATRTDQRAFVFNVDPGESDLRRAAKEDLERIAGGVKLRNQGSGWAAELADRHNDLSESPWFYLLFLAILVVEQALAVHLSFHVKNNGAAASTPLDRIQPTAA